MCDLIFDGRSNVYLSTILEMFTVKMYKTLTFLFLELINKSKYASRMATCNFFLLTIAMFSLSVIVSEIIGSRKVYNLDLNFYNGSRSDANVPTESSYVTSEGDSIIIDPFLAIKILGI